MAFRLLHALGRASSAGMAGNGMVINNWFPNVLYGIMASMSVYLLAWVNMDRLTDHLDMTFSERSGDFFDFIIVGAGSAGGVLAARLAEKHRVLLLEYGGEPHPLQSIPIFSFFMLNYPEIDWQFKTVPQKHSSLAMKHRESLWSQGRALGGTSNVNFLMYSRGNRRDFDNWAEITEDASWNYENVLPFFKKSEDFIGKYSADDTHGRGGEMRIQQPPYIGSAQYYVNAGEELGYKQADLNGNFTEGFDIVYSNVKNGRRCGAYKAFIMPARKRNNLVIRKFSHVNKILFRGDSNEAYAVEYDRHGTRKHAYAYKEIIVSAGAVNSPKLLMLSGIGPKDHLESLGIAVRQDLPGVGKNLQDHTCTYLGPFFTNESVSVLVDRDLQAAKMTEFFSRGTGVFTSSGMNAMGFVSSSLAKAAGEGDWPDMHLMFMGASVYDKFAEHISHAFNVRRDVMEAYYAHARGRDSFLQVVSNGRPHARGEITLRSSNPYLPPMIDPKYLDNDHDVRVMVEGVKKAVELAENTTAFQRVGTQFTPVVFPGCENVTFRSDDYWECFVRQYTVSLHHIVGTCSMGKEGSPNAVVDTNLKVIGTTRLRVIDASVMPVVPVGNTNAPTIMIAEKGADLILKEWFVPEEINNSTSTTEKIPEMGVNNTEDNKVKTTDSKITNMIPDYDTIKIDVKYS